MKGVPVLAAWPQKRRNVLFAPIALALFLVLFLAVGFPTSDPFTAGLVALPVAVAGAWALVGWPLVTRKDGKPLVEPQHRPFLFFALAPILFVVGYPIFGILLTKLPVPLGLLAISSIVLPPLAARAAWSQRRGHPRRRARVRRRLRPRGHRRLLGHHCRHPPGRRGRRPRLGRAPAHRGAARRGDAPPRHARPREERRAPHDVA